MKTRHPARSIEALTTLLNQISAIRVKEIKIAVVDTEEAEDIVVSIDVYGHDRMLLCSTTPRRGLGSIRKLIGRLCELAASSERTVVPVLIAPVFSEAARQLCKLSHISYFDFAGNACIEVGEVFFHKRCV